MGNIEIWNKEKNNYPIIISIPHSGTHLPREMKEKMLENCVLANMDWYLPKLYSFLKESGYTTIINNVSRYVIDTNREIMDSNDDSYAKNYIYTKTTWGYDMYKKTPNKNEIDMRIKEYYNPYHKAIKDCIDEKLKVFDKVYLLDLHSFGKDLEQDIVLGNKNGETSSKEFINKIKEGLEKQDFKVSLNKPYSGGYIIKEYANEKVETVQIELSYKKYIEDRCFQNEELPIINNELFDKTQEKMKKFYEKLNEKI